MSDVASAISTAPAPPIAGKSFLIHARLISALTLLSRLMGLGREIVAAHYLGSGLVASAFTVAFTIPNLFRKLFGEGALSAAFIPLYSRAIRRRSRDRANDFAAASVNLLVLTLVAITVVGEIALGAAIYFGSNLWPDLLLTLKLTAIMLPYVVLICGSAFLSGILQVHQRFAAPAAAPILLNVCHIAVLIIGGSIIGLSASTYDDRVVALQTKLVYAMAVAVLVAGALQVMILMPGLRAAGFRVHLRAYFWTPAVRRMIKLTIPVALGAGVLQLSVLLDKGIALFLMQRLDDAGNLITHLTLWGWSIALPMDMGAPRRLDIAQFLYQFPLGVFAIALATAIFPALSASALERDRTQFKSVLRQGIGATMWEGLPASVGLILVAEPAVRLLFQHGHLSSHDADWIVRSVGFYAGAIWAFCLLQIVNRAYYAIHDTLTPVLMTVVNIVLNLVVEIPLLWWMGEAAMAVGTLVSFTAQALLMLWMLNRRVGGLELHRLAIPVTKMILATAIMGAVLWTLKRSPIYPTGEGRLIWAIQLTMLLMSGLAVYLGACKVMKLPVLGHLLPRATGESRS